MYIVKKASCWQIHESNGRSVEGPEEAIIAEALAAGARVVLSDIPAHEDLSEFGPVRLVDPREDAAALGRLLAAALGPRRPSEPPSHAHSGTRRRVQALRHPPRGPARREANTTVRARTGQEVSQ